VERGMSAP